MTVIPIPPNPAAAAPPESDWFDPIKKFRLSAWRVAIGARLQWLQGELDSRPSSPPGVQAAMDVARRSIRAKSGPSAWFSGAHIERSWRTIHLAEARVIASSADLAGRLPAVKQRALEDLAPEDLRMQALLEVVPGKLDEDARAVVFEALKAAYAVSDNSHTDVRSMRNRLFLFGVLLIKLTALLVVFGALAPTLVPMCVKDICATGGTRPSGGDILLVALLGALGGAVAVVQLLLRSTPSVVQYTLTPYQAGIKVLLGAVFAIIGVLFAGSGVLLGVVANQPSLLVLALVFGYAQQLGTKELDKYANTLVTKAQPKGAP